MFRFETNNWFFFLNSYIRSSCFLLLQATYIFYKKINTYIYIKFTMNSSQEKKKGKWCLFNFAKHLKIDEKNCSIEISHVSLLLSWKTGSIWLPFPACPARPASLVFKATTFEWSSLLERQRSPLFVTFKITRWDLLAPETGRLGAEWSRV